MSVTRNIHGEVIWTRAERLAQIQDGLARGLTSRQIAEELGVGYSTVRNTLSDPDGAKQKARRERYRGRCVVCGTATDGSNGRSKAPDYCAAHVVESPRHAELVAANTLWTRERVVAALEWWNSEYGEPPSVADWGPTVARRYGDVAKAARAERLIADGRIPWFTLVVRRFGTWNEALRAAGFETRASHGGAGNELRRRSA